jgi:hypothetical protein
MANREESEDMEAIHSKKRFFGYEATRIRRGQTAEVIQLVIQEIDRYFTGPSSDELNST